MEVRVLGAEAFRKKSSGCQRERKTPVPTGPSEAGGGRLTLRVPGLGSMRVEHEMAAGKDPAASLGPVAHYCKARERAVELREPFQVPEKCPAALRRTKNCHWGPIFDVQI